MAELEYLFIFRRVRLFRQDRHCIDFHAGHYAESPFEPRAQEMTAQEEYTVVFQSIRQWVVTVTRWTSL